MAGREVADVQEGPGVAHERMRLPLREEPFRDATLIEHLDGAGVQTAGARAVELLTGASFDDDDVDPRQRQLARQHQPGRAASCDHHRMFGHRRSSDVGVSRSWSLPLPGPKVTGQRGVTNPVSDRGGRTTR